MEITLNILKSNVMNEVAKQTSYIGSKTILEDGGNAYEQIFTTTEDYEMLERYWKEAVNATTGNLRKFVESASSTNEAFDLILNMSSRYDESQTGTIQDSLFSYFVNFITSRWLSVAYKTDAEYYDKYAATNMREILIKIFYKKPVRR